MCIHRERTSVGVPGCVLESIQAARARTKPQHAHSNAGHVSAQAVRCESVARASHAWRARMRAEAVSYTHLDVYKRQELGFSWF